MNQRIIPCAVCRAPLAVDSTGATGESSPELLHHATGWFGILRTDQTPPQYGIVVTCSKECAGELASGTPVIASTPIGSA
jgi:hypothetical protein